MKVEGVNESRGRSLSIWRVEQLRVDAHEPLGERVGALTQLHELA